MVHTSEMINNKFQSFLFITASLGYANFYSMFAFLGLLILVKWAKSLATKSEISLS